MLATQEMAEQEAIGNAFAQDAALGDPGELAELEQELEDLIRGDDVNVGTVTSPVPPTAHGALVPTSVEPRLPSATPLRSPEGVLGHAGGTDRASNSTGNQGQKVLQQLLVGICSPH